MIKTESAVAHVVSELRNRFNVFIMDRLAEAGITELVPSHGAILVVLYKNGPLSMKALCEQVHRNKSTLTVLARKLEALGYVRREPDEKDNRVTILHLTEKGVAFQPLFERISQELHRKMWGDASGEEREVFCRQLWEMAERMKTGS